MVEYITAIVYLLIYLNVTYLLGHIQNVIKRQDLEFYLHWSYSLVL